MQALQFQSWLLDRLMAYTGKHRLLTDLLTEKMGQMSPAQLEYFSKATAEAESRSLSLMQMGVGKLDYATLFGITLSNMSESQVHQPCRVV